MNPWQGGGAPLAQKPGSIIGNTVNRVLSERATGRQYWRSLEQLAETPGFLDWLHREFPAHASEFTSGPSRRRMLQLMAASFGLAGLTACRRPVERILTASQGSEDVVPGAPLFYNTIMSVGGQASGLLVECHDGRPTKIEGNPNHPSSLGATSVYAQAAVLGLYDPDRSKAVLKDGKPSSWEEFEKFAAARTGNGAGLRFLSEAVASPSLEAVRDHVLARFPQSKWIEFEPLDGDQARAGAELAFKAPLVPQYHFDRADVVVSLDCDFLGQDAPALSAIRAFTGRRRMDAPGDST